MIRALLAFALATLVACLGPFGLPGPADAQQPASPRHIGVLLVGLSPREGGAGVPAGAAGRGIRRGTRCGDRVAIRQRRLRSGTGVGRRPGPEQSRCDRRRTTTPATQAAKRATSTIPIVMAMVADPVGSGLVASLAHPGGNVTGLSMMVTELSAKRLQLLKETVPRATRVAVLWNPDTPFHPKVIEELKAAAPSLSIELSFVGVRTPEEFGPAFSAVSRAHAQALYVIDDAFFAAHRKTLLRLASKARLPVIYSAQGVRRQRRADVLWAELGDLLRRSAGYVDKILKGAKPGDLPIEQPTKFELVVNLKTAKALGITIPAIDPAAGRRGDPVTRFILLLAVGADPLTAVQRPLTGNFRSTPG